MEKYIKIINQIRNNLSGDKESDMNYLFSEAKKWINHEYQLEIYKEIFRMITDRLPDNEKQLLKNDISNFKELTEICLNDIKSKMALGKTETAEKLIKTFFLENIVFAENLFRDDKVTAYLTFNNLFELYYYQWKFKPNKKIRTNPLVNNWVYFTYAYILIEMKKYDDALDMLNRGLRWNPIDLNLLFEKNEVFKYRKDWENYRKINNACWECSYTSNYLARTFRNYGYMFTERKDYDGAISCYLKSLEYENNLHATNELFYITQKTQKVIDEKYYRINCDKLLKERDICQGPNENILVIAYTMAKSTHDSKDYKSAHYFYSILWDLTKDERIREILIDLNNHIEGQYN